MKLLRFLCLWPLTAVAALDPKAGWEVAGYELTLPTDSASVSFYRTGKQVWQRSFKPQPGDTKFGYTWFGYADLNKWLDDRPGGSGWFRLVEEGRTRVWYDRKRDKQRLPEEIVEVPFKLWFQVRSQVYLSTFSDARVPADLPDAHSSFAPALRYAEKNLLQNRQSAPEPVAGLGDHAWIVPDGTSANAWLTLIVVRGPIIVRTEIQPTLLVRTGPQFADDPILRNVRGGFMAGDLAAYQVRPDADGGLLDVAAIAERTAPRLREELLGLAREFVRGWDAYCAAKVGPGPHFKGLFLDSAALLPEVSAVPGATRTRFNPDMWSSSMGLANAAAPDEENLNLELRTYGVASSAPTADQPLLDAAAGYIEDLGGYREQTQLKRVALNIDGIDEGVVLEASGENGGRITYRSRTILFRHGNVTGRVTHYLGLYPLEQKKLRPLTGDPAVAIVKAVLAKMRQVGGGAPAKPEPVLAGPGTLFGTAATDRLWSDGASTTTLRFEATLADGSPAAGLALKLEVESPFVGDVAERELTTEGKGVATVEYRAGTRAGSNRVTATGGEGLAATVALRHGGLETVVRTAGLQFLADGATPVVVAARLLDPEGKPVAKTTIEVAADESELPARGEFGRDAKSDDAREGWQVWAYTPPQIDPAEGWKGGRVELKFSAKPPGSSASLESPLALTLHSGAPFWCVVEKLGFAPGVQTNFRSERSHGSAVGTAQASGEGGVLPLAGAKVTVYAAIGGKAQAIGSGVSGPDGVFAVPFSLEKVVAGPESSCPVAPAALVLAPETARWLEVARTKAAAFRTKGYASKPAEGFVAKFAADLAAATDDPQNPRNAARLVVAVRLLGEALGYLDELDDQHTQAEAWLNESLEAAVDDLATVIDLGSKVEAAQDGVADYAANAPELAEVRKKAQVAWAGLRKKVVARFVTTAYGVIRDTYKDTADELANREKLGLANDSGIVAWKKWAVNKSNDTYAEWMFSPAGAISGWGEAKLKAELTKFLKNAYRGQYPKFFAAALDHAAGRIARGESTWADPEKAAAVLREDFAPVAETYRQANEAHLNRELARLNLKLAVDTVGKGAAIYFSAKEVLQTNPAEFKAKILESIGNVDKAFAAVDTACQTYNGRQWFAVCHRARLAIADTAVDAAR